MTLPGVEFTGEGGSGATATAVVTKGAITAINMSNYGNGYKYLPTISFTYSVTNTSGLVGGTNYTVPPLITFTGGGGGGSGADAVACCNSYYCNSGCQCNYVI